MFYTAFQPNAFQNNAFQINNPIIDAGDINDYWRKKWEKSYKAVAQDLPEKIDELKQVVAPFMQVEEVAPTDALPPAPKIDFDALWNEIESRSRFIRAMQALQDELAIIQEKRRRQLLDDEFILMTILMDM
jgi:hypothetical protein